MVFKLAVVYRKKKHGKKWFLKSAYLQLTWDRNKKIILRRIKNLLNGTAKLKALILRSTLTDKIHLACEKKFIIRNRVTTDPLFMIKCISLVKQNLQLTAAYCVILCKGKYLAVIARLG